LTNGAKCVIIITERKREVIKMKNLFKRNKKRMFAVAFKEVDQNEVQVDVMDGQSLGYLSTDWAFEVLSVKEI
jgi:hypothetical protein